MEQAHKLQTNLVTLLQLVESDPQQLLNQYDRRIWHELNLKIIWWS